MINLLSHLGVTHVVLIDWENFTEEFRRILRKVGDRAGKREKVRPSETLIWLKVLDGAEPPSGIIWTPFVPKRTRTDLRQRGVVLRVPLEASPEAGW